MNELILSDAGGVISTLSVAPAAANSGCAGFVPSKSSHGSSESVAVLSSVVFTIADASRSWLRERVALVRESLWNAVSYFERGMTKRTPRHRRVVRRRASSGRGDPEPPGSSSLAVRLRLDGRCSTFPARSLRRCSGRWGLVPRHGMYGGRRDSCSVSAAAPWSFGGCKRSDPVGAGPLVQATTRRQHHA